MSRESQKAYSEKILRLNQLLHETAPGYILDNHGPAVWHTESRYWPATARIVREIPYAEKDTETWLNLDGSVADSRAFIYDTEEKRIVEVGITKKLPEDCYSEQYVLHFRVDSETRAAVLSYNYIAYRLTPEEKDKESKMIEFLKGVTVYFFDEKMEITDTVPVVDTQGAPFGENITSPKFLERKWMAFLSKGKTPKLVDLKTGVAYPLPGYTSIKHIRSVHVYTKGVLLVCCLLITVDDEYKSDLTYGLSVFISNPDWQNLWHHITISYDSYAPSKIEFNDAKQDEGYVQMIARAYNDATLGVYLMPMSMDFCRGKQSEDQKVVAN